MHAHLQRLLALRRVHMCVDSGAGHACGTLSDIACCLADCFGAVCMRAGHSNH